MWSCRIFYRLPSYCILQTWLDRIVGQKCHWNMPLGWRGHNGVQGGWCDASIVAIVSNQHKWENDTVRRITPLQELLWSHVDQQLERIMGTVVVEKMFGSIHQQGVFSTKKQTNKTGFTIHWFCKLYWWNQTFSMIGSSAAGPSGIMK